MSWLAAIFNGIFFALAVWMLWLFGLEVVYGGVQFFSRTTNHKPWAVAALIMAALTFAALVEKGVVLK